MTADQAALWLTGFATPPLIVFVLLYPMLARGWHKRLVGWALMISATGLTLMVLTVLLFYVFGPDYKYRDAFRLSAYAVIAVGAWAKCLALLIINGRVFHRDYKTRLAARHRQFED